MRAKKKAPRQPLRWAKATLYAAVWPSADLDDYRLKLFKEYVRRYRTKGSREARVFAFKQTLSWSWAVGWRIFTVFSFLKKIAG